MLIGDTNEFGALRNEPLLALRERGKRAFRIDFKLAPTRDFGAQSGGTRLENRQGRREHCADMDKIGDRPWLDERERRRAPCERLQRRDEPHAGLLLCREPRALFGAQPRDQPDPRFGGIDISLCRLDPRRDRRSLGACGIGLVAFTARLRFEPRGAGFGKDRLGLGARERGLFLGNALRLSGWRDQQQHAERHRAPQP